MTPQASTTQPQRLSEELQAGAGELWTRAVEHRFVRELADGTLDPEVYRAYLVQDHAFVETLVSVLGAAISQAPSIERKRPFIQFAGLVTSEENDYFHRTFEALGLTAEEAEAAELGATTRAFQDLLLRGAFQGGYAETLAVLVPVEWIYLEWATAVAEDPPETPYLSEWVELHANHGFRGFVTWMRQELDREGRHLSAERAATVQALFTRATELEVAFWDQAYALAGGRPE